MNNVLVHKYDLDETINNLKNILNSNNIEINESEINDNFGLYSLNIKVKSCNKLSANGKGISVKHAKASAYAELLERLQNNCNFYDLESHEFKLKRSDEKHLEFNKLTFETKNLIRNHIIPNENILPKEVFSLLPFFNVRSQKFVEIPHRQVFFTCGSNGMCSGNTVYEAITHGICEIYERHILKKFYNEKLKFREIPYSILKGKEKNAVDEIKKNGFNLTIYDMTDEGVFPVYAVTLEKDGKGIINFGSSPNYYIAIQRCLTEIVQGFKAENEYDHYLVKLYKSENLTNKEKNKILLDAFRKGTSYSKEYIENNLLEFNPDYLEKFMEKDLTTKDTCKKMIEIALNLKYDIYIRDVSFMKFPSYYVYIPGLSEVEIASLNREYIENLELLNKDKMTLYHMLNNSHKLNSNEISLLEKSIFNLEMVNSNRRLLGCQYNTSGKFVEKYDNDLILAYLKYLSGDKSLAEKMLKASIFNNIRNQKANYTDGLKIKIIDAMTNDKSLNVNEIKLLNKEISINSYLDNIFTVNCDECQSSNTNKCAKAAIKNIVSEFSSIMSKYKYNDNLDNQLMM